MSIARDTGWSPDFIRWELSLVEFHRLRHAALWLDGHHCRRRKGAAGQRTLRTAFDNASARYAVGNHAHS